MTSPKTAAAAMKRVRDLDQNVMTFTNGWDDASLGGASPLLLPKRTWPEGTLTACAYLRKPHTKISYSFFNSHHDCLECRLVHELDDLWQVRGQGS